MITFPNTIPFEITRDEHWAVRKVVDYLWADEAKDFKCNKADGYEHEHIFQSLKKASELATRAAERFELHDKQVR